MIKLPYKDPEVNREYQRVWQHNKKLQGSNFFIEPLMKVTTLQHLEELLELAMNEVITADISVAIRTRLIVQLCNVILKKIEVFNFEKRLNDLEDMINVNTRKTT